jgi:hypothetical protein
MGYGRRRYRRNPYRVIYAGVEGDSEKALLKWIETLCDDNEIRVRFKVRNCCGGSPRQILDSAIRHRPARTTRNDSLVLIDKDFLSEHEERELERLAEKNKITLIIQRPNFEGIILRLNPGEETRQPPPEAVKAMLRRFWHDYEKPPSANDLGSRYSLAHLVSLANWDEDIATLLQIVGFRR